MTAVVDRPRDGRPVQPGTDGPLLRVRGLIKDFAMSGGRPPVRAVAGVDLDIHDGEVVSIVGESGSGKTTLARCILRLLDATAGTIELGGVDVRAARGDALRQLRLQMQVVFQDPIGSLDPRMSVLDLVAEPMRAHLGLVRAKIEPTVEELLDQVGLGRQHLQRRPHELSGGQCQRVAIARALALRPRLLILDEPTSALDVSVQAQILNLLTDLRERHGLTFLLISHDLGVVRHLSDRVGVMYLGRLVEAGAGNAIFDAGRHPYTRALLAAVPDVEDDGPQAALISGDPPSPASPPSGCRFHPRCWLRERLGNPEECATVEPPTVAAGAVAGPDAGAATEAACHFADRTSTMLDAPVAATSSLAAAPAVLTRENWQDPPLHREGYRRVRDLLPTHVVRRGAGEPAPLPRDERDVLSLTFDADGAAHTVEQMLTATSTDGYLVIHEGRVIAEHYGPGMQPDTPHLLQSVSKSFTGTLAGVLVGAGRLDPTASVGQYVPELASGSFAGATVQHLLDMRSGTRFSEAYEDLDADIRISEQVTGWRPRTKPGLPSDLYAYMAGLENARPHGGPFDYRSILSDVLGWVIERAGGASVAEQFSQGIWAPMGAEYDASLAVDPAGCSVTDGGFSVTLRDLGRFGWMHLCNGAIDGHQVVPRAWIDRLRRPDAELAAAFGGALELEGVSGPDTMYHDKWWVLDPARGIRVAIGIHGQILLVHEPSRTVVAKLSTQPLPVDRAVFRYQMAGSLRICEALAGGSLPPR